MPTSTDPYNSSDRLVEADDVLEPLASQPIPEVATSAQEAAIESAANEAHNVEGSLSLDEAPVEVTQVSDADVFDESTDLTEEEHALLDELVSTEAEDLPERPEATLADGPAYAPSPSFNNEPALGMSYEQNVAPDTVGKNNTDWAYEPEPIETLPEAPKSRVKVHVGVFFATIVLVPIAWYLFADASIRLAYLAGSPWETGHVAVLPLVETVGALIVLGLIWFLARASSLGTFVSGILVTILGAIGVVAPGFAKTAIAGSLTNSVSGLDPSASSGIVAAFKQLVINIVHHFDLYLGSGQFLFYGFLLLMTGVVSHYARRRGVIAGTQKAQRDIALGK